MKRDFQSNFVRAFSNHSFLPVPSQLIAPITGTQSSGKDAASSHPKIPIQSHEVWQWAGETRLSLCYAQHLLSVWLQRAGADVFGCITSCQRSH